MITICKYFIKPRLWLISLCANKLGLSFTAEMSMDQDWIGLDQD